MGKRKSRKKKEIGPVERQQSNSVSKLRQTNEWGRVVLLVEPYGPFRDTLRKSPDLVLEQNPLLAGERPQNLFLLQADPKGKKLQEPKCRLRLMTDGYNAITELKSKLKQGRSVDAVVIDNRPINGDICHNTVDAEGNSKRPTYATVEWFLDLLEKAIVESNTSVKTLTVIPIYNAEWETKSINQDIAKFRESYKKDGTLPHLVISKPQSKISLYTNFNEVLMRTLRKVETTRKWLDATIDEERRKSKGM